METNFTYDGNRLPSTKALKRSRRKTTEAEAEAKAKAFVNTAPLAKRMEEDLVAGIIKPTSALSRLQARYGKHLADDTLVKAMGAACRSYGQTAGRSFVVTDPDTDRVLSSSPCPDVIPEKFRHDIGWAMWQCILRTGHAEFGRYKDYNEKGELFLEVYALPRGSYRATQIERIRAVGDHILTFMRFDLDKFQLPEDWDLGQKRRLQGLYSPRYGLQGFNGKEDRYEWADNGYEWPPY